MEQVITTALFFDGYSARPAPVAVLLSGGRVHLHDPYDNRYVQSFPLADATYNHTGPNHFLYLDAKGLLYLQFTSDHPLLPRLRQQIDATRTNWADRLMRQKLLVLVPAMAVLAVGLYFLLVNLVPFFGLRMIGRESEIRIGDHFHAVMLKEAGLASGGLDTSGTYQLQSFANSIRLSREYPIRLTLVHSRIVNAYALPGGQVVVYTGLLKKIKSPEALAALLAHESTHVNERHSLRSMLRSSANSLLVSIIFGDATGISGALAGNIENLSGLRYSRSLEQEADEKGMKLLQENGIAPKGMVELMKTLQKAGPDLPDELSFLSSHPLTRDRIHTAEAFCKKPEKTGLQNSQLKSRFEALLQTL